MSRWPAGLGPAGLGPTGLGPTVPRRILFGVIVFGLMEISACVTTAPAERQVDPVGAARSPSTAPALPAAPPPPASLRPVEVPHGLIVDLRSGEVLDRQTVAKRLAHQRHIYVGEFHANPVYQGVQLEVLKLLQGAQSDLAIGIEWLDVEAQPVLDAWMGGTIDEVEFVRQVNWKKRWGHSFTRYAPLLRWARRNGVPVWALNTPARVARAVAAHGPKYVSPAIKALLTPMTTANPGHREFFMTLMESVKHTHKHGAHPRGKGAPAHAPAPTHKHPLLPLMERFYWAQVARDERMAATLAARLKEPGNAHKTAVVFAGLGHVDHGYGIPARAKALLGADFQIILPVMEGHIDAYLGTLGRPDYPAQRADLIWEWRRQLSL